jgi:prolipoprotein diacylglyceryltransferase
MSRPGISFRLCGVAGLLLGAPLAIWLALERGLSPWIELLLIAVAVSMLLLTPLTVKVFTGRDGFVFYRDVICIFAAVAATLHWLRQPLLPYLDVTIAGAGLFHACGRIGCLLSSCCHGRPSRWGIRYNHAHAGMGFPAQLVGVRLFPIQAVESFCILCLAATASIVILGKNPPGTAFAFYISGYAFVRFWTELARGDSDRPYLLGFSQSQWISLLLALGVAGAGRAGMLPVSKWSVAAAALLIISMLLIAAWRRLESTQKFHLLHPRHVLEIAEGLSHLANSPRPQGSDRRPMIDVMQTSQGIQISCGETFRRHEHIRHYGLSSNRNSLHLKTAEVLARQISRLHHNSARFELIAGTRGVFHVLFPTE